MAYKGMSRPSIIALSVMVAVSVLAAGSNLAQANPPSGAEVGGYKLPAANCAQISVGFTSLPDLGAGTYQGYQGGLYPGGVNVPPSAYLKTGLSHAAQVTPLNGSGQPDPANGRIVLLSIGMSNTTQEFTRFKQIADPDSQKNPKVTIVDGAVGGQDATIIRNPNAAYWTTVTQRLTNAGVNDNQVQAIWLKEAIAQENKVFPADAQELQNDLKDIEAILEGRFHNLQLVYVVSRTYAGYATSTLNPEPYSYQSGFAVKWLIQSRIRANRPGPWMGWGPYLWTDGMAGRSDGLVWQCADTQSDGTHPSASGQQKVAEMLLKFFKRDQTANTWFLR